MVIAVVWGVFSWLDEFGVAVWQLAKAGISSTKHYSMNKA
jgi:hypothetical protein